MRLTAHLKSGASFLVESPGSVNSAVTRAEAIIGSGCVVEPLAGNARVVWPISELVKFTIQEDL